MHFLLKILKNRYSTCHCKIQIKLKLWNNSALSKLIQTVDSFMFIGYCIPLLTVAVVFKNEIMGPI